MNNEEFDALVSRLEAQARKNPQGYRTRVILLALLGDTYLLLMLAILVLLLLMSLVSIVFLKAVGIKIAAVIGFFLWVVVRALRVNLPPPQGFEVRRKDVPELFGMIRDLQKKLRAPAFHHVLLIDDFNAAVVQIPRLGIFGWPRNYLLLGLPLMKSLTVEQFKAVLAHEFGHLAHSHGRMSNWIYRQRLRWARLMNALEMTESKGGFLFRPFLKWYAPYFEAYSFPLARANEYEADAAAVQLTSKKTAAEALTGVNVVGSYLAEKYWSQIHRQADSVPQPGFAPFAGMAQSVTSGMDEQSIQGWMSQALARTTTSADTHPSLSDRLEAIRETPRLVLPQAGQSADCLLGQALGPITEEFDRRWQEAILPSWERRYNEVQEARRRLGELDAALSCGGSLSVDEGCERARLNDFVGNDPQIAIDQLQVLLQTAPNHTLVNFMLGLRLLARNDEAGCAFVERAMATEESCIVGGAEALRDFYWRGERKDMANFWHGKMVARIELEGAADKERSEIRVTEKFDTPDLAPEVVAKLKAQLKAVPGLRKAYLVKRRPKYLPQHSCYALGYAVTHPLLMHSKKKAAAVQQKIMEMVEFPASTMV
ncbi:MAG: M48 family metalloprotease, partial [Burkholderiales bacterium]|nr:M48 family metalloprotease [Burkholderiales bacterium]